MTRFHITLDQSVELVLWMIKNSIGGEIAVSKIPSLRIIDIIKAMNAKYKVTGIRPGEKLHEDLISSHDSLNTISLKKNYLILPQGQKKIVNFYKRKYGAKNVKENFSYNSYTNHHYLKINEIKQLIKKI